MTHHGFPQLRPTRQRPDRPDRRGQPRRHHHRVVRLLPLRLGRRARVQHAVLPQQRPARRHPAGLPDVRGRLRRPAARRRRLRPLRRQDRPQEAPRDQPADDGRRDLRDGSAAHPRQHRRVGADPADGPAAGPGLRSRRRVGRRGPPRLRTRRRRAARLLGLLAAGRSPRRQSARDRRPGAAGRRPVRRGLPRLGLAHPVPPLRRPRDARPVDPDLRRGVPGLPGGAEEGAGAGRRGRQGAAAGRRGVPQELARGAPRHRHPLRREHLVLHPHRVPPGLCDRAPGAVQERRAQRRTDRLGGPLRHHPAVGRALGPDRPCGPSA